LCVVAGGAYWFFASKEAGINSTTAEVVRGDIRSTISATGKLSAVETVDVGTQISGTVTKVYIDYNSAVKAGDLIAEIDPKTLQSDVDQANANLLASRADLLNAKAVYAKAASDYSRTQQLAAKDLVAKADVDSDKSAYEVAKAQVAASEARVAQSTASLSKAKINLGYTKIYSPVDGVVVAKNVDAGQTVAASYQTPSIAEIARNLAEMQVEVNVDEADIGGVKDGQKATFTVDAFPMKTFSGEVTQIRLSPTTTDNVVTYTVIVRVANDEKILMPGMTANVSLLMQNKDNVLIVPNSALRFRPTEAAAAAQAGPPARNLNASTAIRKPSVYTLDEKKQPVKHDVERGITDGQNTEILSGVKEGDHVITGILFSNGS
jgi:HlyD family secretion protein